MTLLRRLTWPLVTLAVYLPHPEENRGDRRQGNASTGCLASGRILP